VFTAYATLRSSAFGPRPEALVGEPGRFGGVVRLRGLALHFGVPGRPSLRGEPCELLEPRDVARDLGVPFEGPLSETRGAPLYAHP